jgi:hypothetical protein
MSNLSGIIPYTELFETAALYARDTAFTSEGKFKALINNAYTRELIRNEDWDFLVKESSISCSAKYNTGTVAITAGATALTGTGTVWTSAMTSANGWKIKFSGNDLIYDFTRTGNTAATISPALSGATSLSGAGYTLFRDSYSLASDFFRFLLGEEGGLKIMKSGKYNIAYVASDKRWREEYNFTPSDSLNMCRLLQYDSSRNRRIQINPPSNTAIIIPYSYIQALTPMTEYTTGYISAITNGATGVTGLGTAWNVTGNIDTSTYAYYFRMDVDGTGPDSVWYKIDSVGGATSITLASNYGGTTISSGISTDTYTISRIPEMPSEFHDLLIYCAVIDGIADEGDPNYQYYMAKKAQIYSECKMMYKSRRLNTQFGVEDSWRGQPH